MPLTSSYLSLPFEFVIDITLIGIGVVLKVFSTVTLESTNAAKPISSSVRIPSSKLDH
jgi:hypothetical protein